MSKLLHSIGASNTEMRQCQEGFNPKSIRRNRSVYYLAYAFELLFYAYHKTFLHTDATLFGINSSMMMYAGHIIMSLVIMLLWTDKFKRLIHVSLAVTVIGFAAFLLLPDGIPKLLCAVATMTGLGGCVTSARCGFAFGANNTERLLSVVIALGGRALLGFIDAVFPDGAFWDNFLFYYAFPIIFLAAMVFCLLRFRESDLEAKEDANNEERFGLYWAFAIFIAFFAIEGYSRFMYINSYAPAAALYAGGQLVAAALFIVILFRLKKNIWHIWNLFFGICIIMSLLAAFGRNGNTNAPVHVLLGISEVGWIAALYLLGCAQRRFASYKLLKKCTLVFVIVSPITTLSDELVESIFPESLVTVTLIYILLITVAFLMVSPYTYKFLFDEKWLNELYEPDMRIYADVLEQAEKIDKENTLGLTPREMEIFALLLTDASFKQISASLNVSDNTVRFHSKNLYRKLSIQSRAELFAQYGKSGLIK
ncbi:MAG: helix-turn-helix transcriptional regulator [Oscillospiraceae bacterium]|nr:helix-turn-helix transcriptional regulator [Oscillospiraceae bacterium]